MEAQEVEIGQRREVKRRKIIRRKKAQAREKQKNHVAIHYSFFHDLWPQGSETMPARAAGAEPSGQMRRTVARLCGANHNLRSTCTKHRIFRRVEISKSARQCATKHVSKSNSDGSESEHFCQLGC